MAFPKVIFIVLAMVVSTAFGGILPYASSYNSHTINHAIATPIAPAPFIAPVSFATAPAQIIASPPAPIAAAPLVASPYAAPFATPYSLPYPYPHLF